MSKLDMKPPSPKRRRPGFLPDSNLEYGLSCYLISGSGGGSGLSLVNASAFFGSGRRGLFLPPRPPAGPPPEKRASRQESVVSSVPRNLRRTVQGSKFCSAPFQLDAEVTIANCPAGDSRVGRATDYRSWVIP